MKLIIKSNIPLTITNDSIQSTTILSVISFNKNKKRNQIIYYKDIQEISINEPINISKEYPYLGFILVKYYKVDRKYYQYPLILIDTSLHSENECKIITIPDEIIKKIPFGNVWKKSLKYEDFIKNKNIITIENDYLCNEDYINLITEDGNKIIIDVLF